MARAINNMNKSMNWDSGLDTVHLAGMLPCYNERMLSSTLSVDELQPGHQLISAAGGLKLQVYDTAAWLSSEGRCGYWAEAALDGSSAAGEAGDERRRLMSLQPLMTAVRAAVLHSNKHNMMPDDEPCGLVTYVSFCCMLLLPITQYQLR
jgi:hypothetical protein